jgi:hypothetical protein
LQIVHADTICLWNFNSTLPDGSFTTGAVAPVIGAGYATLVGGTTASFVAGGTPDPESADDTAWSISKFPSTLYSNRMAGVRFMISTLGFEKVRISWAEQHSSASSRYMRPQYTVDGENFVDLPPVKVTRDSSYTNISFDLSGISSVTNNPLFGFQILAEFESTAAGGLPGYIGTTAEYSSSGTVKFDMVSVTGQTIGDSNTPPYVFSEISDQVLPANSASEPLSFTVLDAEQPAVSLDVEKSSSDPSIVPLENIVLGGSGALRTVIVQAGGVAGQSRIGLRVVDAGGKFTLFTFGVTVLPANSAPVIAGLSFAHTMAGTPSAPLAFTVSDAETPPAALVVEAAARDSSLVPAGGLQLSGSGTNRILIISPAPGRSGVTPLAVTVSDGENTTSMAFPFMVLPSPGLVLYEPFNYATGPATTNSAFLWEHRSGAHGDCVVTNGTLRLGKVETEDAGATLIGAPYEPGTGAVLYASMKLRASGLPAEKPDHFAHFVMSSSQVGRIAIGTTNAFEGTYRVYIGNGVDATYPSFPMSMNTNVLYTVVIRYDVDTARTTLWVNPASEQATSVTALDVVSAPGKISAFAFRQSTGIAPQMFIDDLKVGLSFAAVTGSAPDRPWLHYERGAGTLRLSWDNPAHLLQRSGVMNGPYTNVPGASSPYDAGFIEPRGFFRLRAN